VRQGIARLRRARHSTRRRRRPGTRIGHPIGHTVAGGVIARGVIAGEREAEKRPSAEGEMTVPIPVVPAGARVRVRRGKLPVDPALLGRTGIVVEASEYRPQSYGVALDGETTVRVFATEELEVLAYDALPPERQEAKQRRALP
jgi:hypothetical protein